MQRRKENKNANINVLDRNVILVPTDCGSHHLDAVETLKAVEAETMASSFLFVDNPFLVGVCNVLDIDVDTSERS
jgi:hypothetical protein